jgi:mannose-6-phosphate isomerase-like protein (cupin superfamily)
VFDVERLKAEIGGLADADWNPHYNTGDHDGGWLGFPLRAAAGSGNPLYPDPLQRQFIDLPVLAHWPAVRAALATFQCPLRSVRLLKLRAGSVIREHRDNGLAFEQGEVRLHVPIVTNPEMAFYLDGERLPMAAGETWYVNVNLPHRVRNAGNTDRIHLVIDCTVNDWIAALFAAGERFASTPVVAPVEAMAGQPLSQRLDALRQGVWNNPALQLQLFDTEDMELFVRRVAAVARGKGHALSEREVQSALQEARRSWNERYTLR